MDMKFKFKRKIFEIKPLAISRINLEYVKKTSNPYINYEKKTINDQIKYVKEIRKKGNEIYQIKYKNKLIATSGFQFNGLKTYQGLLIIDNKFLGKRLAKYFIYSSVLFVNKTLDKNFFYANIDKKNISSIKSFVNAGYKLIKKKKDTLYLRLILNKKNNALIEKKIKVLD
tara:strand:+ start:153 stop:665 length:513 start_codon:yes stop_codon:yes gene_type:complete